MEGLIAMRLLLSNQVCTALRKNFKLTQQTLAPYMENTYRNAANGMPAQNVYRVAPQLSHQTIKITVLYIVKLYFIL